MNIYQTITKLNKILLPSLTKQGLDIAKAKKWQLAIIGWKYYVLKKSLK